MTVGELITELQGHDSDKTLFICRFKENTCLHVDTVQDKAVGVTSVDRTWTDDSPTPNGFEDAVVLFLQYDDE